MAYQQLIALLPCHSLDDFPFYLEGTAADQVLDGYTALWHPALLADAKCVPTWRRNDSSEPHCWEGVLVTLPQICRDDMPGYWLDEVREQGAVVLNCEELSTRDEIMQVGMNYGNIVVPELDPSLVADFLALGFCHLLTEVLTVRMRYSSLLDVDRFAKLLIAAADSAIAGEEAMARESLGKCFDALSESKDHFYPVDSYLFDLTLIAPTTELKDLSTEIARKRPINLLISAADIYRFQEEDPAAFIELKSGISEGRICLVGAEISDDAPLSLLSIEGISTNFRQGISLYEQCLGTRPVVFGRRRFGLSCNLPQLLCKWGFLGALHYSLDGNRCPESYHGAIKWQGADGSELSALARPPLDARSPESFLSLPRHLGDAMDNDHVAAIGFAHWPCQVSRWYEELLRIEKYGSVLGKFVTLKDCFEESNLMSGTTQFEADDYRSPYLRELGVAGKPAISPLVNSVQAETSQRAAGVFSALAALLSDKSSLGSIADNESEEIAAEAFSAALPREDGNPQQGYLVLNPYGSAQSVVIETALESPPDVGGAVKAAAIQNGYKEVLVDVPPFGYAWISAGSGSWASPVGKLLLEKNLLRNEFIEVYLDADTGGIRSVYSPLQRGNIFSQRLALRMPQTSPSEPPVYAAMIADKIENHHAGPLSSAITSHGRLLDNSGELMAQFTQTVRIIRGMPILYFDTLLTPVILPQGNPWQSYYASRVAWPGSDVFRGVGMTRRRTHRRRLEAPHFLDLQSGSLNTTLLSSGLPYHVLVDDGQIDTLLISPGETERRFQFAVGFNLPSPARAAMAALVPPRVLSEKKSAVLPASGWVIHLSDPHVIATNWEIIFSNQRVSGLRLHLLETKGRSTLVTLQSFCEMESARKLDFLGSPIAELTPAGDQVAIELIGTECCLLELVWKNDCNH